MVSTQNTRKSNVNPPRMQDQPGDVVSRPPGALETMQANTEEVETLCLSNQRLIGDLEQLTRQMQRPREAQRTQEGHNITPHEGQLHLGIPRGAEGKAKSSRARGHRPHLTPGEEGNEATPGGGGGGGRGGTSEMRNYTPLSKERWNDHGSRGSKISNKSSAT